MHVLAPDQLNTYDVLVNDVVVFTRDALDAFLAGPIATGKVATSVVVPATSGSADADSRRRTAYEPASEEVDK